MKLKKHFFLCFVLFFKYAAWADAKWQFVCLMPNGRYGHDAAATPDGRIYAIGGTDLRVYKNEEKSNIFLVQEKQLYAGKVQETVEVPDIFKLGK